MRKINMKWGTQAWNVSDSKVESKGDSIDMNSTEREWRENEHSIILSRMLEHCIIGFKSGSMLANVLYEYVQMYVCLSVCM